MDDQAASDIDRRITGIAGPGDPGPVVRSLTARRDDVLRRWLAAAARQPFHEDRPDAAVADHIPELFDALVRLLGRDARAGDDAVTPPMDDPAVARPRKPTPRPGSSRVLAPSRSSPSSACCARRSRAR